MPKKKKKVIEDISPNEEWEVAHGIKETIRMEQARGCKFSPGAGEKPNVRITPLELLKNQKQITPQQYGAGVVYGNLYKIAHFVNKYPCALSRFSFEAMPDVGIAAMSAVVRAQKAIGDGFLIHQVDQVCGWDKTPTDFLKLKDALYSLQKYYYQNRKTP